MKEQIFELHRRLGLPKPVRVLKRTRLNMQLTSFQSRKNDSTIKLESSGEHDFAHLLEWDKNILCFVEQPLVVQLPLKGRAGEYVPDFLHVDRSLNKVVTEIKPGGWNKSPALVERYRLAEAELHSRGMDYQVVSISDLRSTSLVQNLRYLYPFFYSAIPSDFSKVTTALRDLGGGASISELLKLTNGPSYRQLCAYTYKHSNDLTVCRFGESTFLRLQSAQSDY